MPPRTWATTPRATMQSICTIPASASPTVSYPHTHRVVKMAALTNASAAVVARPVFVGKTESLRARAVAPAAPKRASVVTLASADETSRRAALSTFTVSHEPRPGHLSPRARRCRLDAHLQRRRRDRAGVFAPRVRRTRASRGRCIAPGKKKPHSGCGVFPRSARPLGTPALTPPAPSARSIPQAAGVALAAKPSLAAYGDSANVFGSATNTSGASATPRALLATR
jgi:hypothetical protein